MSAGFPPYLKYVPGWQNSRPSARSGNRVARPRAKVDLADENSVPEIEQGVQFTELPSEDEVQVGDAARRNPAVLHATDWTAETIISQLKRGNIVLNPSFQRRDAWSRKHKSRFIE